MKRIFNVSRRFQSTTSAIKAPPSSASSKASPSSSTSSATKTSTAIPHAHRFWKKVEIRSCDKGYYAVTLDGRSLKTPAGSPIQLKNQLLASIVASEWDSAIGSLKSHSLPMTSLIVRAIDDLSSNNGKNHVIISDLMAYLKTDTILYKSDYPPALISLQTQHWDPIIEWANMKWNVKLSASNSLFRSTELEQYETDSRVLKDYVTINYGGMRLAGLERAVMTSKSFLIGLALMEGQLDAVAATDAARVEILAQLDRWGTVGGHHDLDEADMQRQLASCALANNIK